MSKEVTRYDLRVTNDGAGLYATDEPNTRGMQYVRALDYDALLAERDALAKDAERYQLLASTLLADCSGAQMTTQEGALYRALNAIEHVNTLEEIDAIFDAALQGAQS